MNFAVIGVGSYIAPKHLTAINELGHKIICAFDKNDSVGILDRFSLSSEFFTEFEKFEEYIYSCRGTEKQIDYVTICSPNDMHFSQIKFALKTGANVICEKPLVLTMAELNNLIEYQKSFELSVNTILQLRLHDSIINLKKKIEASKKSEYHNIDLNYVTSRGPWYKKSWKNDYKKSGGLATNIGIHFFDMLTWIFGEAKEVVLTSYTEDCQVGELLLERARVKWKLSISPDDLPKESKQAQKTVFRQMTIDNQDFNFTEGFTDLHKKSYYEIINQRGFNPLESISSIEIVEKIRKMVHENYKT
jgi:UDP-N-acetyl-2-amino-2-deoxyglucuronate dehydrogenase